MDGTQALQRFTTRYIPAEDRMRMAGDLPGGQQVVLWLPQRLWLHLLPGVFAWLEKQAGTLSATTVVAQVHQEVQQSFALAAARQGLQSQPPVVPSAGATEWLVDMLSVERASSHLCVVFQKGVEGDHPLTLAALQLSAHQWRQWLLIVHRLWQQAEWPAQVWPAWWVDAGATHSSAGQVVH